MEPLETCTSFDKDGNPDFVYTAHVSSQFGLASIQPIRCEKVDKHNGQIYWLGESPREVAFAPEILVYRQGQIEISEPTRTITFSNVDPQVVGDFINGVRATMNLRYWESMRTALPLAPQKIVR